MNSCIAATGEWIPSSSEEPLKVGHSLGNKFNVQRQSDSVTDRRSVTLAPTMERAIPGIFRLRLSVVGRTFHMVLFPALCFATPLSRQHKRRVQSFPATMSFFP